MTTRKDRRRSFSAELLLPTDSGHGVLFYSEWFKEKDALALARLIDGLFVVRVVTNDFDGPIKSVHLTSKEARRMALSLNTLARHSGSKERVSVLPLSPHCTEMNGR